MKRLSNSKRVVPWQQRIMPFTLLAVACLVLFAAPYFLVFSIDVDGDDSMVPTTAKPQPTSTETMTVASAMCGSPPLDHLVFPFDDLCAAAAAAAAAPHQDADGGIDSKSQGAAPALVAFNAGSAFHMHQLSETLQQAREAEIASVTNRFDHVPATGGASAERWSAATGLPLRSDRTGEVKVRFVTASNRLGTFEQAATTAATMVGVQFTMLGLNWKHFTYLKRMGMMLSYVELEDLKDSDIIVGLDSDALFSGDDPYGLYEAFVASTAESLAEHRSYSLRDIRFGKRLPPFLFGAEFNCMRKQALEANESCHDAYHKVNDQAAKWAARANVTLPTIYTEKNPFRLMNTGVFIARVWALRVFNAAAQGFMKSHLPKRTNPDKKWIWMCDQSAMTSLVLDLLLWEFLSGAMDGAAKPLTKDMLSESVYPPMLLPKEGDGPNGLPGGIVGIEASERFVLTVGPELSERQFYRIGSHVVRSNHDPEAALRLFQATSTETRTSVIGVRESLHRINIKPRPAVDCVGVNEVPPECAYRDAVLGIPPGTNAVVPLMWHFAGKRKEKVVLHFRGVFPWYTPTIQNATALHQVLKTLLDAPPVRVFETDSATDVGDVYAPMKVLPHNVSHDLTFLEMCQLASSQRDSSKA